MAATEAPVFAEDQHIIERPRLTRMLDESTAKVILLLAPAGYGKTTLARQWLRDKPHIWYRASAADADVAALAVGVATRAAAKCAGLDRRIRERILAAHDPEHESGFLAEIVAEDFRALAPGTWIVIDDYHHAAASPASELFVTLLVEALSTRCLFTTRKRPGWATARNVVYGGTAILNQDDLAMTEHEAAQVLGKASRGGTLFHDVMGWPAAIGLAARVGSRLMEAQPLSPDLYDFFAEELWRTLPRRQQLQLAQLSLFEPTPWLIAEDLFGDAAIELVRSDLSAGWVSREGGEIIIHPLLRRFLKARFQEIPPTRRRAAVKQLLRVLEAREQWDQAIALALETDEGAFSKLFLRALDSLLEAGRLSTIERWLESARHQGIDSPEIELAAAEIAFRRGDYLRAEALGREAARASSDNRLLRARSLNRAGMSATLLDHTDLALSLHREARECAPDTATLRESIIGEIGAALDLGLDDCEPLLAQLPDGGSPNDLIRAAGTRLLVALRLGDVSEAVEKSTALMPMLADVRDPLSRTSFLFLRAGGLVGQAMYPEAVSTLSKLEEEASAFGIDLAKTPGKVLRAAAEAGLRNFARARKLIGDAIADTYRDGDLYWRAFASATQARVEASAAQGEIPSLRPELARIETGGIYEEYVASLALAAAGGGDRGRAEAYVDEARRGGATSDLEIILAWVQAILSGRRSDAVAAFDLSMRRGMLDYCVVSYRAHPYLLGLLAEEDEQRRHLEVLLVRANDRELFAELGSKPAPKHLWRQRLTPREKQVYSLMVDGLSNRRIAEQLVITESTAKLHVRHILEKLCARSRTEAVAKWRDVLD